MSEHIPIVVAGIDVGGKKGFHAVSLRDGQYHQKHDSKTVADIVNWCRYDVKAEVIAIDAPCRWSLDGRARPAERQLMQEKIWCFSSPTKQKALNHPKNNFGWMLNGEALYLDFERTHPLYIDLAQAIATGRRQLCFETFPHAIVCSLLSRVVSAKNKNVVRRELLTRYGIATHHLTNIDLIDAALCAVTAHRVASGLPFRYYGESSTGFIIVPKP